MLLSIAESEALSRFKQSENRATLVDLVGHDLVDTFESGFDHFCQTGLTVAPAYLAMRRIFMATKGISDDFFFADEMLAAFTPRPLLGAIRSTIFKKCSHNEIHNAVSDLRDRAIHVFSDRLSTETLAEIRDHLIGVSVKDDHGRDAGIYPETAHSPRVFFSEFSLLTCAAIRSLALDPVLVNLAWEFFGVEPVLESIRIFRTLPHDGRDTSTLSAAAQMFHRDRDKLNFLKVFVYINDVAEGNGPHCLIAGSQRDKASECWQDRRYSDEEVSRFHRPEDFVYVKGLEGTIFVANTSAFHKGTPPRVGSRTMLQFHYVSSLFGSSTVAPAFNPFVEDRGAMPVSRLLSFFPCDRSNLDSNAGNIDPELWTAM